MIAQVVCWCCLCFGITLSPGLLFDWCKKWIGSKKWKIWEGVNPTIFFAVYSHTNFQMTEHVSTLRNACYGQYCSCGRLTRSTVVKLITLLTFTAFKNSLGSDLRSTSWSLLRVSCTKNPRVALKPVFKGSLCFSPSCLIISANWTKSIRKSSKLGTNK